MADVTRSGPTWHFTTAVGVLPPAPTGLRSTFVSSSRVDVAWTNVGGEQGYRIERKLASDSTWLEIGETVRDVAGYSDADGLRPDSIYNYRVCAFTAAGESDYSNILAVKTSPVPSRPDVVLYAAKAPMKVGNWSVVADATAATGARIYEQNAGAAKRVTAAAVPANYFEMTFDAMAGQPYHLWMRMKADADSYANDSVHVQFTNSVTATAAPIFRIGRQSSAVVNLEDCGTGCGVAGWGWQDNGWGLGILGSDIYFSTSGSQTIRIQQREDGVSIDQIVLSPSKYRTTSPGALKNDRTILQ